MDTDNNIPADAQEPAEGAAQTAPETSTPPADAQEPAGDAPAQQAGTLLGGGNDPAQQGAQDAQQGAGVPESYDFHSVMPEGAQYDQALADSFAGVAKDAGLSQASASKIAAYGMPLMQKVAQQATEAAAQAYEQKVTGWADSAKQALGADFDKTMSRAGTGIEALEKRVPGLRQALNESGAGNQLALVQAFALIGDLVGEDVGKLSGGTTPGASNIYPKTNFNDY